MQIIFICNTHVFVCVEARCASMKWTLSGERERERERETFPNDIFIYFLQAYEYMRVSIGFDGILFQCAAKLRLLLHTTTATTTTTTTDAVYK